jgi:hypothetical protein
VEGAPLCACCGALRSAAAGSIFPEGRRMDRIQITAIAVAVVLIAAWF